MVNSFGGGSIPFVRMQQLWDMAARLPSKKVRVSELNALDEVRLV